MIFWIAWSVDALIALILIYFFLIGLADGSVSSFNLGLWGAILLVAAAVLSGGLLLRGTGHLGAANSVVLAIAVPGFLVGLFFLALLVLNPRWN